MAERARIAKFFAPLAAAEAGSFQLTDDAALLTPPLGKSIVITTDSVIEGIHLLPEASPQHYAQKLVRRNLSDLAAMGATPWRYTLNLHTPRGMSDDWFAVFAASLEREQEQFGMVLTGGDSTSGDGTIHLTLTCLGLIEGTPLRRSGAHVGDDLYVSGSLGDAAFALHQLLHHAPLEDALAARYFAPEPRLALGQMLRSIATAAMDISDGLLADLQQLCAASGVSAEMLRAAIPLHPTIAAAIAQDAACWRFPLSGGDDYELLFTAAPDQRARIEAITSAASLPLTRIGKIVSGNGIALFDEAGNPLPITESGWEYR